MDDVFDVFGVFSILDNMSSPLGNIRTSMRATRAEGGRLTATMGSLTKKMLPLAMAAALVLAAFIGPVGAAMEFEAALSNLQAISQATPDDLAKLEQSALDLGASTAFSAAQVAGAQTELAKKGFLANETVAAMPGLLNLAAATQSELATAATVSSGALKSFNMEASKSGEVADIIAAASTSSATDIDGLGMALQNAGAIVSGAGEDFALLAAITGKLADANINAAVAGTATKIMFTRLASPAGDAAKALSSLKIETKDAQGNMLPFLDIMGELEGKLKSMGSADRTGYIKRIFGEEAVGSVTALLNQGVGSLAKYAESLRSKTGISAEMAKQQLDNLKGSLTILGSAWEGFSITLGSTFTPILKDVVDGVTWLVMIFTVIASHPVGNWLVKITGYAAGLVIAMTLLSAAVWAGSAAWGAFTSMRLVVVAVEFVKVARATNIWTASQWLLNAALTANPIGLVIVGIAAFIAGIIALYNYCDGFREIVDATWASLKEVASAISDFFGILTGVGIDGVLAYYFTDLYNGLQAIFDIDLAESGRKMLMTLVEGIKSVAMAPYEAVKSVLSSVRNLLPFSDAKEGPLSQLTLSGSKVLDTLGEGIAAAAPKLKNTAEGALEDAANALTSDERQPGKKQTGKRSSSGGTTIHIGSITLPGVESASSFVSELQQLVAEFDGMEPEGA